MASFVKYEHRDRDRTRSTCHCVRRSMKKSQQRHLWGQLKKLPKSNSNFFVQSKDPPSFKAARKRDKERLLLLEKEGTLDKGELMGSSILW